MVGDRWIADPNVSAVNVERNRKSEAWRVGKDRLIASVPFKSSREIAAHAAGWSPPYEFYQI